MKVGASSVLPKLKLNYSESIAETQNRKIIFITPSNIKNL